MKENYKKDFEKSFNKLAYKHGHFQVFENFLDCAINGFCFNYSPDTMESVRKRYTQDERYIFGELIKLWIFISKEEIHTDNCWFDFFGNFYESNSMSKQKGFAQYFTPEPICKLMVELVGTNENDKSMHEPACGSGRFNLAKHAVNPKLFHHANDLDFTCVKMSALNFMLHGIKGVVTCDDALNHPGKAFRSAFIVNDTIAPSLYYTTDYNFTMNYLHEKINPYGKFKKVMDLIKQPQEKQERTNVIITENEPIITQNGQISLF